MSVQTTTSRISYTGNGTSTVFAFNYKILDQTHLQVYLNGVLKTLTTDYTVSGVGAAAGGIVTFGTAPAAAAQIVIARVVPVNQLVQTVNNDTIFSVVFDQAIDKLTMIAQQLSTTASRGMVLADSDPTAGSLVLPVDRANKYLRFDANGLPSTVDSQITTLYYGPLTADPSTRPDGSAMQAGDLYYNTATALFKVYSGAAWAQAIPTATLSLVNYAETSATSKTTFTIPGGYSAGSAFVYLNGALLEPSEYTASNGTTVVLGTACAVGDEFRLVGFSSFSVANALPLSGGTISGNLDVTGTLKRAGVDVVAVAPGAAGTVLQSNGTSFTSAALAVVADLVLASNGRGTAVNTQTFNGSGTWTKPASGALALVEVWGAGGSGGRHTTAGFVGGGGGSGFAAAWMSLSELASTVSVTVGAGGVARTGSNQAGASGGASSFGSFLSANGGGGGPITGGSWNTRGPGGTGSTSGVRSTAQSWFPFIGNSISETGSGDDNVGENYAGNVTRSGAAGAGGSAPGTSPTTSTYGGAGGTYGATGGAGVQPGGGGGGATSTSGAGGDGRVRVTVF
jgi:hypothetical protein